MKRIKSTTIIMILLFSLFSASFILRDAKSDDTTIVVWLCADPHIGQGATSPSEKAKFWDAINDTNSIGVDYAFCVGDCIYNTGSYWADFKECWDTLNVTYYKNITVGNHDFDWNDNTNSPLYGAEHEWYYVDIGNIRVVVGGDERTKFDNYNGHGECFMYNFAQQNFINSTIQNASNNSMNAWILFHQPLNDTVDRSDEHDYWCISETNSTYDGAPKFNAMLKYLQNHGMSPSLMASGHTHNSVTDNSSSEILMMKKYNVTMLQIGSITGASGLPDGHDPCSRYLYLTVGSSTVTVKSYNHANNSFVASREYTFELAYPFSLSGSDSSQDIQFISIDGGGNGTVISTPTPTFNWSVVNHTTRYQLQIANDSSFSDIVIDISDINEQNYPSEYDENSTRVSFQLPSSHALQWQKTYYCRVRAMRWLP